MRRAVEMSEVHENICAHWREMALDEAAAVRGFQALIDNTVQMELRRFQSGLRTLTPDQRQAIQLLLRGIANRILHLAVPNLTRAAREGDSEAVAKICELYGIAPLALMRARRGESG